MVYESDFYTVRRPRPTITSYSVTGGSRLAGGGALSNWHVKPSVRSSVILGELDRIYHRPRPHLGNMALEDYLNSRPLVEFDDETKQIRAETDKLRRRIHTAIPHPRKSAPLQILPYYSTMNTYEKYTPSPDRHHHPMVDHILYMSYYSEPSAKTIGRGHLACVTFAGGRGYPRRRNHYFSDENRDIGEEIKTRSYYNNSFTKSYADAMSLPTGYASYLLRLKPPESNGTLTNLDKMHIIALAEERKRNIKRNKTDGGLIDAELNSKLFNGTTGTKEKDTYHKFERRLSKPEDEITTKRSITEPEKKVSHEESSDSVSRITKQDSVNRPEPDETLLQKSPEEAPAKEEPEQPKAEKKPKQKKSSLSRNSSIQETQKQKVDEVPARQNTGQNEEEEEKDVPIATNQPEFSPEAPETIKLSSEREESLEEAKPTENLLPQEDESEILPPEEPEHRISRVNSVLAEQTPEELVSLEPLDQTNEKEEVKIEDLVLSSEPLTEAVFTVATEEEAVPSDNINEEEEDVAPAEIVKEEEVPNESLEEKLQTNSCTENFAEDENTEDVTKSKPEEIIIESTNKNELTELEEDKTRESAEPTESAIIPPENNEEASIVPIDSDKDGEVARVESSQIETEVTENNSEGGTEVTSTVITSRSTVVTSRTEVSFSENIVEEESRTSECGTPTKENQPEPLIEEPQSPCDTDIITNILNSNDICEVLSDVPEEL